MLLRKIGISLLSILLLLCLTVRAVAQPDQYRFSLLNVKQGLSHNEVISFYKDDTGFLWIGTISGLNRFDGYTFKVFRNNPSDTTSISDNHINRIFGMPGGYLGILTSRELNIYNPQTETFTTSLNERRTKYALPEESLSDVIRDERNTYCLVYRKAGLVLIDSTDHVSKRINHNPADSLSISAATISAATYGDHHNLWIIHTDGLLEDVDLKLGKVTYRNKLLRNSERDYQMMQDKEGDLWIYSSKNNDGVYYFNSKQRTFRHIHENSPGHGLSNNLVRSVVQDNQGIIWVGTDHGGINLINKKDFSMTYLVHNDEHERSLVQNSITTLFKDNEGIIWIGTYKKGINYYHENVLRFPLYRHYPSDPWSLNFEDVNRFVEDDQGNLWIGTNGGGLIYFNRSTNKFTQYRHDARDPNSLSSDVIVSLYLDRERKLWIGTYYGGLNCFDGKKFTHYIHDPDDPNSIADANIWEIFEDSHNNLWIGTLDNGLDLYDRVKKTFIHFKDSDVNSVSSKYVSAIIEDRRGNLWIGTDRGIDVMERPSGRFLHYEHDATKPTSLSNNIVYTIMEDSRHRIWAGTAGGLNLFDSKTRTFRVFTEQNGLPHNSVLTLLEDNNGDLWMSTPNGLANLIFQKDSTGQDYFFKNYDESDGLQGNPFNENAAMKTRRGELIFGGANGFNIFEPRQVGMHRNKPPVVLTDFRLFDKSIMPGEKVDGMVPLNASIATTPSVTLKHSQNVFSIEFAALSYLHPEESSYKYKLEGFNSDWLTADAKARRITFTNLNPGDYVFRVKAANADDVWNEEGASIKITILPPFWKTRTAMALYLLVIVLTLVLTRYLISQSERMRFTIEQERREAERMHQLDLMKIRFFTNVSHEFRTPLTLILTPVEKLLQTAKDPEQQHQFQLIYRNASRLLNLVNQLLDFRKLEVQDVNFNPSEGDIIRFTRECVYSFSDLSEKKDIRLEFNSTVESLETIFDQDKLGKILFNLLSNAFKFTPEHGSISVQVQVTGTDQDQMMLVMNVSDTGIGIPHDKLDKIFERFFQYDDGKKISNRGSGIGLSITREFVKIHGGTITVNSEVGKGSCFTVSIPVRNVFEQSSVSETAALPVHETHTFMPGEKRGDGDTGETKRASILIVEDNEDFRFYLKDNLQAEFRILEAKDGKEGWSQALKNMPDLIVSDVMMPEVSGLELCRKLKSDQRLSHIPVILLTAQADEEQKLRGYQIGANDYITKPFNVEILLSRINNLLALRTRFDFARLALNVPDEDMLSPDEKLLKNAIRIIEENIAEPGFSVENLSRDLGLSRTHMYNKLVSLTGKSPLEFIRTIRLHHAARLLEKSQFTVAEVAYKVGFNNPKYFTRYFKEEFNVLPSMYAASKRGTGV